MVKYINLKLLNKMQIIDPDLYKQKQGELLKARIKFQEEYEKSAKIALEKQKEVKKSIITGIQNV